MHQIELILTLAGGLGAALIFGYITQRIGLSPIVGYLIAGVAVGPHTPGFVANTGLAEQLAELGVILLMFGVGLQFRIEELLAVRRVALPGAITTSAILALLASNTAHAFGWDWSSAIVFGLSLSVASTVVLVRVLADNRELHTPAGHIAVGWLVVEDLFAVIVLVLLPTFAGPASASSVIVDLGFTLLKVAGLVAFAAIIGQRVIPTILDRVAATRSRELFTLTVLVLTLGIAVGSATVFGVSMALGAFLAGMVVGRSDYSLRAATEALPMRDAFAVLFFVSVGMLLNPSDLMKAPGLVAAMFAIVVVGKPVVAATVLLLMRYPIRTALTVSMALGQVGEFSFILTTLARTLGLVPAEAMNVVVAVSIASITLNSVVFKTNDPLAIWLSKRRWFRAVAAAPSLREAGASSSLEPGERAIVIGYGPTGRTVSRLLRENGVAPTIVDLNMEAVRDLREAGVSAVYGDARYSDILVSAGLRHAGTLIVSGAGAGSPEVIKSAREINPTVHIFVRGGSLREVAPLRSAGAEQVFSGEGEVALAMTEAVLRRLGATPDQVDRERARVREELFGTGETVTPLP